MNQSYFVEALKSTVVLTNFLQLAHWGTRGMFAYEFHQLFGKLYEEMSDSLDKLGELASIKGYAVNSEIFNGETPRITSSNPAELLNGALNLLDEYKDSLLSLYEEAERLKERGIANALDDRFTQIDLMQYLLEANLPSDPEPLDETSIEIPLEDTPETEIIGSK